MRYPRPLVCDFGVRYHIRTIVFLIQLTVDRTEILRGETLPLLCHAAGAHLKFRKHRLTVDRPFEAVEIMVEQISTLFFVRRVRQQMFHQQDLVTGGRHLRDKNPVLGVDRRLVFIGIPGVHRMSHLVGERKHIVQRVIII